MDYKNVPKPIAAVLSITSDKTGALRDMQTILSVEDVYDILEVSNVDAHNQRILNNPEG